MTEGETLQRLASDIQAAVSRHSDGDKSDYHEIQNALEKLRWAIEPPYVSMSRQRFRVVENICIIIGFEIGLFDQLIQNQSSSLSASDLADATGYDQLLIVRTMRMLTALGFANETGYQTYTANALTAVQNSPGGRGAFILTWVRMLFDDSGAARTCWNDMMLPLSAKIRSYLREHKPCDSGQAPPAYDFAMGEDCWTTFRKNAEWKQGFDDAMAMRMELATIPWFNKYPIRDRLFTVSLNTTPVIVDIGGNQGSDLQRLADRFPTQTFKLILQDLPETIDSITTTLDSRISPTVYDFFTEQPVKGADIYYLKSVLHDWDDTASHTILSNAAKAMKSHSRLLINEMVLPDTNAGLDNADMDMLMLFMSNGMERTETQWKELLASIQPPLKILEIYTVEGDAQSVIEAVLA